MSLPELDPGLVRALVLSLPVAVTFGLWAWQRPRGRRLTGMFLSMAFQVPVLLLLNSAAPAAGWWRFAAEGGLWLGVPVDLLVAWVFLWGAIPALLPLRLSPLWIAAAAFGLDLLLIPLCRPVIDLEGPRWLLGEVLCIAMALLPGLSLARWTAERRNLVARAILQAVGFGGWVLFALPTAILLSSRQDWHPMFARPTWEILLGMQVVLVFAGWGLAAVQELATRGLGTALPQDPTRRLVVSGPYAYIANPMQLTVTLMFLAMGVLLKSAPVGGAGVMVLIFSAGLASWHEGLSMRERFGAPYTAWRENVRPWVPRWRPWVPFGATLYYAEGCTPCEGVARWIRARQPVGLTLTPAQQHPHRDLVRLTYDPGDGSPEEEGVAAFLRALEHATLGWACLAWLGRLPGVLHFLQLVVDASGGGPRLVPRSLPVPPPSSP